MNNATACFYLSGLHIAGIHEDPTKDISVDLSAKRDPKEFVLQKDMAKAFSYATKACDLRNMYACANLSQMYARGDGTEKNEQLAAKYKKLAMEMQDEVKKSQQTLNFQQWKRGSVRVAFEFSLNFKVFFCLIFLINIVRRIDSPLHTHRGQ